MSAPDFAATLRVAADSVRYGIAADQIDAQLAAKVPELCQTCEGYGLVAKPLRPGAQALSVTHADCPGCPTIGQLLAIGAAVVAGPGAPSLQELGWTFEDGWAAAIAHLRAVQP